MAHIVLISFYDRICLSNRALSTALKSHGHRVSLYFLKDDRTCVIDGFKAESTGYQNIFNNKRIGCNADINPITEVELRRLQDDIIRASPDVIGISARTVSLDTARIVVTRLRQVCPGALYIGGGYGPTLLPEAFLQFLDFVCLGEGDQAVVGMLTPETARATANVAWLEDGALRFNPLARPIPLDTLGYPDWEPDDKFLIDDNAILPIGERMDTTTYDIFASRGCPANCSYCMASQWDRMYRAYSGNMPKVRLRSPQSVIAELQYAKARLGIEMVRFKDSIFGFHKRWLFEFMALYDQHINLKFNCLLDERFTDEETIRRLADSGLDYTIVGIQSADEQVRKRVMQRQISNDGLVDYAWMLKRNQIKIKYDIIGWNPFETDETLAGGVSFLKRLPKSNEIFVFQLKIFPGSPIFENHQRLKPEPLPDTDYQYWAWIYQLILRSDLGERLAGEAMADAAYRKAPDRLRVLLDQAICEDKKRVYAVAAKHIPARQLITNIMVTWQESETIREDAVPFDDKSNILNRVSRVPIRKGEYLQYGSIFGAYENIGRGQY